MIHYGRATGRPRCGVRWRPGGALRERSGRPAWSMPSSCKVGRPGVVVPGWAPVGSGGCGGWAVKTGGAGGPREGGGGVGGAAGCAGEGAGEEGGWGGVWGRCGQMVLRREGSVRGIGGCREGVLPEVWRRA